MPLVGIKSISPGVNTQYHTEFWRLNIEYENLLIADSAQTKNCYTFHCLRVQAWHLNISQLFDDLGHENHIWKPGDLPEGCSVVHLDCSIHLFWTQADPSHLPVHHGTQEGEDLSQLVCLGSVAALHWSTDSSIPAAHCPPSKVCDPCSSQPLEEQCRSKFSRYSLLVSNLLLHSPTEPQVSETLPTDS